MILKFGGFKCRFKYGFHGSSVGWLFDLTGRSLCGMGEDVEKYFQKFLSLAIQVLSTLPSYLVGFAVRDCVLEF